ncbi:hypothetical protein Tco_0092362 [Tanacetum coccineum]
MVGNTIDTVTSVLTQRELDSQCSLFNISTDLRPELPDHNATIKDSLTGKIGMYTHFVEFANFRVPLSKFLLCVLEYYQINLAQLSISGAEKVSYVELMCRVLGRMPTADTFRRFYVNSISNGWISFSKRSGADVPCCYSKNLDSVKNWNNHFFWIDSSVCLLSIPWFNGFSVTTDPLFVDDVFDLPCVKLLDDNRTVIWKDPKIFLCVVGLSRSYTETDVRPTFLDSDDEEMGLLDFFKSTDPFKVKIDERTLAENEVLLLEDTEEMVISPSVQTVSLVDHTIEDELKANMVDIDSGSAAPATEDFVSSSVTPTLEHDYEDGYFMVIMLFRLFLPCKMMLILLLLSLGMRLVVRGPFIPESGVEPSSATPSQSSPIDDFYESQTIDSATAHNVYVPNWNVANDARITHLAFCRKLCSIILLPPDIWPALLVSESDDRHEIMTMEKFEKRESRGEAAEVSELLKRVSDLDIEVATKASEIVSKLRVDYEGLQILVSDEAMMREEFMSLQDVAIRRFEE